MDTISEFCTRIRNAVRVYHEKVDIPSSRMRERLAEQLKSFGYIRYYKVVDDGRQGIIRIYLKYKEREGRLGRGQSVITQIERLSKPSRRRYVKASNIPDVLSGRGLLILSTNQGVLSGEEARKRGIGGELLCQVW